MAIRLAAQAVENNVKVFFLQLAENYEALKQALWVSIGKVQAQSPAIYNNQSNLLDSLLLSSARLLTFKNVRNDFSSFLEKSRPAVSSQTSD